MRIAISCITLCVSILGTGAASANRGASDEDGWLAALYDRVGADLGAGEPLVVEVHVPLCDNRIIRCGGHGLGNGDSADKNLYWSTSGGFRGWFGRRGSGWREVRLGPDQAVPEDVLEVRVWQRRFRPDRGWRARGVREPFDVYVVAHAWRGTAIRKAMDAYVEDLFGAEIRRAAASAYAEGQGKPLGKVFSAFTNPSDPRWRRDTRGGA